MSSFKIYRTIVFPPPVNYGLNNLGFQMFIEPSTPTVLEIQEPTTLLWGFNFEAYNVVTASAENDAPYSWELINEGIDSTDMKTFPDDNVTIETTDTFFDFITANPFSIICLQNLNTGNRYGWIDIGYDLVPASDDIVFTYDYTLSSMTAVVKHFVLKYDNIVSDEDYTILTMTSAPLPAVTAESNRLTANGNGALLNPQTGLPMSAEQTILVKNQVDAKQNGVYNVFVAGDASNPFVLVRQGLFDGDTFIANDQYRYITDAGGAPYTITSIAGTVGTNNISFGATIPIAFGTASSQLYPFSITSNTFSMSIWIKKNATVGSADDYTVFGIAKSDAIAGTYYHIAFNQLGNSVFNYGNGVILISETLSFGLTTGWQNVVFTVSGTTVKVYLDVALMHTITISNLPSSPYTAVPVLQFQPETEGVTHSYANVACWNSALTQLQINYLFTVPHISPD